MATDAQGLVLTTDSEAAERAYNATMHDFLEYRLSAADHLGEMLTADPGFAMGQCLKGALVSLFFTTEVADEVRAALEAAEAGVATVSPREQMHIKALRAWYEGDYETALDDWDEILVRHPTDILALRLQHQLLFWMGRGRAMCEAIARVHDAWDEGTPGYGNMLGMYCFALEEAGDYAAAEPKGRRAVELNPDDMWALHAVAHVLEMQGRQREGVEWLARPADAWDDRNPFKGHVWWHLAMYHLELRQFDRVLELYDTGIYGEPTSVYSDLFNASAMLWRLEFQGVDVGDRWQALADQAASRVNDHVLVFTDVHVMMSLAGGKRFDEAGGLLASLEQFAATPGNFEAGLVEGVTLPLCRAILAYAQDDHATAIGGLRRLRPEIVRIGGSWAQRDVFTQFLIEAALKSGDAELARALLAERAELKPGSASSLMKYGQVLTQLDMPDEAAAIERRIEALTAA
ncbi:MAG: tetratricopeptide repeat protein [Alphaproteobacteria bacterium]|jgi:tetratricopeptide (TPR) repeat protein|nr:tetratricopeptide repeat protein [Alphaproteobacteria bacterium]